VSKERLILPKVSTVIVQDSLYINTNKRTVYIQIEPEAIIPSANSIIDNSDKYAFILTFNADILKRCKNAYKYIYGTTWLHAYEYNSVNPADKKFMLTSVTGTKLMAPGHHFRQVVYNEQLRITSIPTSFYISGNSGTLKQIKQNPTLSRESKMELFQTSQFSLVIENSMQENYFTEKLCDCLITKTIPVYSGCPNISEFFDTTGWIMIDNYSMDELISKLNTLTEDYYMKHMDIVEKNFHTVKKYIDFTENINNGLRSIPGY
jgi:hypothetical protein